MRGLHIKRAYINLALIIGFIFFIYYAIESKVDLQSAKAYLESFGNLMPIAILILIIISSSTGLILIVPTAISAILLDLPVAFLINVIGLIVGAMISFFFARILARDFVEKRFVNKRKWLKEYDDNLEKNGFITIFFLRIIMLAPFELVNIAAGLSKIKPAQYFFGTLLGILPGTFLVIYFYKTTQSIFSMEFLIASAILTLFSLTPLLSKKVRTTILGIKKITSNLE